MPDYDFKNLSPYEFEDLTRDLLQKQRHVVYESFAAGKDGGIDFRYSLNKTTKIILQCKQYSQFSVLMRILKKEVEKVRKLKPKGYILITSLNLTPHQKDKIFILFNPFIKNEHDIYTAKDLNNLLAQYPEIERQHFKLWLSSSNILSRILHSKVYNTASFEEEEIKDSIKLYVKNDSYERSLEILKNNRYLVISGIPGIGKTTLGRILVYYFLSSGFEEFIFLSDSIDEGYRMYQQGKKQVFLFDDFLGRNFLGQKLKNNEEQRIVKFIEKVSKSEDKILILTTREYILKQAETHYDIFDSDSLEVAKCVIDLSHYTKIVRAKILYNHIYFSDLSRAHIDYILKDGNYRYIIKHQNYSPRIIQIFTNSGFSKRIKPQDFIAKIKEFLDYPDSIWKHVFENQISALSQVVLANLMTMGTPVLVEDLRKCVQAFSKIHSDKYSVSYSELTFGKSIKELENTFLLTQMDGQGGVAIEYQNPSVQDFLVRYYRSNQDILKDIFGAAVFFNQFFTVITLNKGEIERQNEIYIKDETKDVWINSLLKGFHNLPSSLLLKGFRKGSAQSFWFKRSYSDYSKLTRLIKSFRNEHNSQIKDFVKDVFGQMLVPESLNSFDFDEYISLVKEYKDQFTFNGDVLIKEVFNNISYLGQVTDFEKLEQLFPDEFTSFVESDRFSDRMTLLIGEEVKGVDNDHLTNTLENIEALNERYDLNVDDELNGLKGKIDEIENRSTDDYDWDQDRHDNRESPGLNEDKIIQDMFDSLRFSQT